MPGRNPFIGVRYEDHESGIDALRCSIRVDGDEIAYSERSEGGMGGIVRLLDGGHQADVTIVNGAGLRTERSYVFEVVSPRMVWLGVSRRYWEGHDDEFGCVTVDHVFQNVGRSMAWAFSARAEADSGLMTDHSYAHPREVGPGECYVQGFSHYRVPRGMSGFTEQVRFQTCDLTRAWCDDQTLTYGVPVPDWSAPMSTLLEQRAEVWEDGWARGPVSLWLTTVGGVDRSRIYYRFGDGETAEFAPLGRTWFLPPVVTREGVTSVAYWSAKLWRPETEAERTASIRIDRSPPQIVVLSPRNFARYEVGQRVTAAWTAHDEGCGLGCVSATARNGSLIDTSASGGRVFVITATDKLGHTMRRVVFYRVGDAVQAWTGPFVKPGWHVRPGEQFPLAPP